MMFGRLWHRAFLEERPSISLSLFRFAVAFTVGAHMIPSFFQMEDNYLAAAFREKNFSFFPLAILRLVDGSPDWIVWSFVWLFGLSLFGFTLGLFTQVSAILMTLSCYYFYALNSTHIGTLSFDILLVTLVLVCVTPYLGDFLSLDSLRRGDTESYKRLRPVFVQRLLQLQLAFTFWHTALQKITAGGNWVSSNPWYFLMQYPSIGVVRDFPFREWLAGQPEFCYAMGLTLIGFEFILPVLWFLPRTRVIGIPLGIAFQLLLWMTLHVPTIFLFLFPPMMLLFIRPQTLVRWIETRQAAAASRGQDRLFYDGRCGFCLESIQRLQVVDLFRRVALRDFHLEPSLAALHPELTPERCRSEMVLLEAERHRVRHSATPSVAPPGGRLSGGFHAFRRLCVRLPLLWPLLPLVYLPGASWVGSGVYRWVAEHRYLLHRNPACQTNQCAINPAGSDSSKT